MRGGVCVVMVVLGIAGCGKRQEDRQVATRQNDRQVAPHDSGHTPPLYESPAEVPHVPPPQPSGPQIGRSDPLMNEIAPEMAEWVAMWGTVLPGFRVDSLWGGKPQKWEAERVRKLGGDLAHEYDGLTFRVLGLSSPDDQRILFIDSYQLIDGGDGGIESGGEPDSKPVLIDRRAGTETTLSMCGTGCGYHWGRWLSPTRFALSGWQDAGDNYDFEWKQGSLSVYDLRDSTVARYVTRIVPRNEYRRYYDAWQQWLLKRYRETKPRS
jgi:hypothetical protein